MFIENKNYQTRKEAFDFYENAFERFKNIHEINKQKDSKLTLKVNNNLPSGMISIDNLNDFSKGLQEIYRKITYMITESNGLKISKNKLRNNTSLLVSNVKAGSFQFDLLQKNSDSFNTGLNYEFEKKVIKDRKPSLENLTEFMSVLHEGDMIKLAKKYNYSIFKNTERWIRDNYRDQNTFNVYFKQSKLDFDKKKIENLKMKFNNIEFEEKESKEYIEGKITVVNHKSGYIILENENTNTEIKVNIEKQNFKDKNVITNKNVKIVLTVIEDCLNDEVIKSKYLLENLEQILVD